MKNLVMSDGVTCSLVMSNDVSCSLVVSHGVLQLTYHDTSAVSRILRSKATLYMHVYNVAL